MPPTSRGKPAKAYKVVKPKKNTKRTTISTRNHRFQSFNERISNLKIDPVRRKRHVDAQEEAVEESHTHFGSSLEEWRDTNLSHTFTTFAKEVAPLCDNLPVVLYNENKIMDLLVKYIDKGDALAMEPILTLLAKFAQDLDERFEKHFERAVATVTSVAAKHSDFAVIEWSFTCLAWLFKYLSRLLVPDLRPLYDLLAPYFGKTTHKPFIIRFTAEAMSFLLRKAATVYQRDSKPLDTLIEHMLSDLEATKESSSLDLYKQGVMTLLTEAIKGVQGGIHNSGAVVLQSLFKLAGESSKAGSTVVGETVTGTLTSLIHHCKSSTFQPVLDGLLAYVSDSAPSATGPHISFCSDLLFTIVSVRKGTRVSDWKKMMQAVQELIARCDQLPGSDERARTSALALLSVSLQTATIDAVLASRKTLEIVRGGKWQPYFLRFCDMVARFGTERFREFVLPHFQKFVLDHAQTGDDALYSLIPRLAGGKSDSKLKPSPQMVKSLQETLADFAQNRSQNGSTERLAEANQKLAALPYLAVDGQHLTAITNHLLTIVEAALRTPRDDQPQFSDFALGAAFHHLLDHAGSEPSLQHLWPQLCGSSNAFIGREQFWTNLLRYLKLVKPAQTEHSQVATLEDALVACLSMPSHSIRQDAIDILQKLYQLRGEDAPSVLSIIATIESVPVSLDTSRTISMNIRRLVPEYAALANGDLMKRAIPTYCFGLLHVHLSQAWEDSMVALSAFSEEKAGEEVVISIAESWLNGKPDTEPDESDAPSFMDINSDWFKVFSDFECPNFARNAAIRKQVFEEPMSGVSSALQKLSHDLRPVSVFTATARNQALNVLAKIPHIAEKRSRLLVPVLLRWAGSQGDDEDSESTAERWSRKDQKAMLGIFARFVNPRVLYKSQEVYDALLSLCANGDVEIQRSALKAVLAWKEPAVKRYEEHLLNLLDEACFREELSVFLRDEADDEDDAIRPQDHAQLMPVLLRLLYGRAIAGGKEGQSGRRKAIFVALSRFGELALGQFVDIGLAAVIDQTGAPGEVTLHNAKAPLRQQFGMLNMVNDMLHVLGAELETSTSKLMSSILSCAVCASQRLEDSDLDKDMSLLRSVRQAALQCLVKIYTSMTPASLEPYGTIIVNKLVTSRLSTFVAENAQSLSGLLRLFASWAEHETTARIFAAQGVSMLEAVALLLEGQHTKSEVRLFILQEIVEKLTEEDMDASILQPHVSSFVKAVGTTIDQQPSKELLDACVKSFSQLAGRITSPDEAANVTKTCGGLLTKPNKAVSPSTKTGLLRTLLPLIDQFAVTGRDELYSTVSALFSRLHDSESRLLLSQVLKALVKGDASLSEAANTCEDMNAMGNRLDEVDHDRRERAFAWVYDEAPSLSLAQWQPIVHNCLFYIRDPEDRVNRSSACHALQLFVDAASQASESSPWMSVLDEAVMTGIERGMRQTSELVRAEYLQVLGHIVEKLSEWPRVGGMRTLVVGGDDEASFFSNVLHIQQHRRLRALRRLSDEGSNLASNAVSRIFLPLLEHFVFDQIEGDSGRTLADQTVQTIGSLAKVLNRSAFRATFQRYTGYLKSKAELEKIVLRLLGALVDGMHNTSTGDHSSSRTVIDDYLPPLLEYLHQKDESTVDRRMPVAVTIVKLMMALPDSDLIARLPAVLTDVCHVLRSRAQEARDQTRKALASISALVGNRFFGFILKELRSALKRGYQLHVLSFTVHSLLVEGKFEPGDLDECLPDLMLVIMDDIFGVTGQEKDAEEYKSGMKEVKSSKSFDTMELLAKTTLVPKLGELVRPIRSLLSEKLDLKTVKKIDELLARLRKGLDQNPASDSRDMLSFCWEIVSRVYAEESAKPAEEAKVDERAKRYLIQPEEPKKSKNKGATTSYRFKLISFALNLLRKVVRRHEDLQTPQNMAGFLPMAGDALIQGQEEVKLSAMRLFSTIMRVPLPQLEANAPVYVQEAVAIIKGAPSMSTDAAKAALELITSVLREKRSVGVKEKDVALVLKRIKTDIDEPDRQGIIYKFLRATLGRKIVITEMYETMDEVGKAMVTSPDRNIRESGRGAYLQFVMEYPQGKDRWQKQTSFLVGNLQYEHAAGRQSVMEFLNLMLGKIGSEVLAEISSRIFVSLLPVLIGDTDDSCRDMARILVARLFEHAGDAQLAQSLSLMDTWLKKEKKSTIKGGALQCWAVLLRTRQLPLKRLDGLREKIEDIISDCAEEDTIAEPQVIRDSLRTFAVLVETAPAVGFSKASVNLWQAIQRIPSSDDVEVQEHVASLLGTFFTDVASTSSKTADGLAGLPLRGSGGLEIGAEDMRRLCSVNLRALRAISLATSQTLTTQIVRNLVFMGRCFAANEMPWTDHNRESDNEIEAADEDEAEEDAAHAESDNSSALSHLLRRLSSMLMADKFSIMSRTATLQTLAALLHQLTSIPNLQTVLRPLYALTDPSVPKPPGELHKALEDKANETLELIQKKIGPEVYVSALAETRSKTRERRDERRRKRRIEAVSEPERWAKDKKKKYEGKKLKQKAKGMEARGKRRGW
ncbi:hypothetical protein M409DRAFT_16022 [Zasmidium cellare ATCC 36951]|uniref:Uncharacterized protein n=1 Tax=Zasmidium cellare ATCC 36951 TaxID=1080233 RepID=A0A6A6D5Q2_ZASCE|nr:uncharacterized protein M409DRAFT_16022 [Zasmidium cellare ATCC 36951]KAF2173748.1 hypothetical protein M409DRAFT_16022 [Zasmidium cellare ATCC 36951]